MSTGRKIAFALSLSLLLISGVLGIYNGITERSTGVTNVAGLASVAYAGEDASWVGAVAGSVVTGLLAAGVVWTARVMTGNARMSPSAN